MKRWILVLCLLAFGVALAQRTTVVPISSLTELNTYLQQNIKEVVVIGDLPLRGLEGALRGKRVRVITGQAQVGSLSWLRASNAEVRVLPGRVEAAFLLANGRFFLVNERQKFSLLDSEDVVKVVVQRIRLDELWQQARPWR